MRKTGFRALAFVMVLCITAGLLPALHTTAKAASSWDTAVTLPVGTATAVTFQSIVGLLVLNDAQIEAADVNHDGSVDAGDAIRILRYDAKLIDKLN